MTAATKARLDEIARMARLAQQELSPGEGHWFRMDVKDLERFFRMAQEEEREACAKVCDAQANHCEEAAQNAIEDGEHDEVSAIRSTAWKLSVCASKIRARGGI